MTDAVTRPTTIAPATYLASVDHPQRRADGERLRSLFERVSGEPAVMWGPSIVGFGHYHYRYDSGREGDAPRMGFSPRKANLVIYLASYEGLDKDLAALGKHKKGSSCLYLNKLADVDLERLEAIVRRSWDASARQASC